ncbi:hypothetical protein [Aporhodopirellula aestuarii]|uniref:Uncharacterized protein n=1 Tax=Aporhodopirellula aestuarii TaxID=2950107 RepID=A0ABT0TZY2_9BACT|nr:hypothetical protein [Aporhodopirellula aestuarii]MCM2370169.1 hypothetical protein [Aporhodopirellula aestuarii]
MLMRNPECFVDQDVQKRIAEPVQSRTPRETLLGQIVLIMCFIIAVLLRSLN